MIIVNVQDHLLKWESAKDSRVSQSGVREAPDQAVDAKVIPGDPKVFQRLPKAFQTCPKGVQRERKRMLKSTPVLKTESTHFRNVDSRTGASSPSFPG